MPTRTRAVTAALTLLAAAGLTLTACSSNSDARAEPTDSGYFSYSPLPTTLPASEAPIPDSKLAKAARTAACWLAIRDQYEPGTVRLTGAPTEPPACLSLSTDEVSAIALDVAEHQSDG